MPPRNASFVLLFLLLSFRVLRVDISVQTYPDLYSPLYFTDSISHRNTHKILYLNEGIPLTHALLHKALCTGT